MKLIAHGEDVVTGPITGDDDADDCSFSTNAFVTIPRSSGVLGRQRIVANAQIKFKIAGIPKHHLQSMEVWSSIHAETNPAVTSPKY